jgi:hypothetical protein
MNTGHCTMGAENWGVHTGRCTLRKEALVKAPGTRKHRTQHRPLEVQAPGAQEPRETQQGRLRAGELSVSCAIPAAREGRGLGSAGTGPEAAPASATRRLRFPEDAADDQDRGRARPTLRAPPGPASRCQAAPPPTTAARPWDPGRGDTGALGLAHLRPRR